VAVRALIFDYFGTLTVRASALQRRAGVTRVAAALGVPGGLLFDTISSTFTERATGSCGDMLATMAWVARRCGYQPSAAQLHSACEVRTEVEGRYARSLRDDALTTLDWLRRHGLRVGVVSDCTHELPESWPRLPVARFVDATVFSVLIGHRKPHLSLYQSVCRQLGIEPSEAIYVGDGGSNELTGAIAAGIPAIRLVTEDAAAALVYDAEPAWTGPVIHSLTTLTQDALADLAHDTSS
jgi:putative hydrolase of the HAD superfamily